MNKGTKVVYIDDSNYDPSAMQFFVEFPVLGNVYTVRKSTLHMGSIQGLLLEEIKNPMVDHPSGMGKFEPTYGKYRFVPLEEYKDSEILEEELSLVEELLA